MNCKNSAQNALKVAIFSILSLKMAIPSAPRLADSRLRRSATRRLRRLDPCAFGARPCPPFANPGSATGSDAPDLFHKSFRPSPYIHFFLRNCAAWTIAWTVSSELLGFCFWFLLIFRFCAVRQIRLAVSSAFERMLIRIVSYRRPR